MEEVRRRVDVGADLVDGLELGRVPDDVVEAVPLADALAELVCSNSFRADSSCRMSLAGVIG